MSRHQVLIVEDDPEIREALVDILEDYGCETVSQVNGARALAYLKSTASLPCLILLDLMMPVMDGETFRDTQLKDPTLAHIPVVVVSAARDLAASARRLQAASFIKKPPNIEEVLSAVTRHC